MPPFERAVELVLDREGVLSDRLSDAGGRTKYGISWNYHERELRAMFGINSIDELTRPQAIEFYRSEFWNKCRCDDLPWPLALVTFNAAVQSAPEDAARLLQSALLTVKVDGLIGPETVRVASSQNEPARVIERMMASHLVKMTHLPTWGENEWGWTRRLFGVAMAAVIA